MKTKTIQKYVAIYVRVSTGHQIDKCSLPFQKKSIEEYVKHVLHVEHFKVYEDAGKSAKNTKRPAFERMMNDLRNGLISHVIVYKIDRISRNLVDFSMMYDEFKKYEATFISLNEQFDTSSAMGEAMLKIILVFAELERKMTSERVAAVMLDRASQGKWNGAKVPLGFKWSDDKKFPVIDTNEAERVKMIYEMYDKGMRTPGIVKYLNENNIPTKRGGRWTTKTIADIIRNPFYKGTLRYNYRKSSRGKIKPKDEWVVIENNHEPLIDPVLWDRCNQTMDENNTGLNAPGRPHTPHHIHVFGKLLKCASCGETLRSDRDYMRKNGFRPSIYACSNRRAYYCSEPYISDVVVGPFVFNYIRNIILVTNSKRKIQSEQDLEKYLLSGSVFENVMGLTEESLTSTYQMLLSSYSSTYYNAPVTIETSMPTDDINKLQDKKAKLERALERLKDVYLFSDESMSQKEFIDTKTSLETQIVSLNNDISALINANPDDADIDFIEKASSFLITQHLQSQEEIDYKALWLSAGQEALNDLTHSVIDNIVVHDGHVQEITFKNGLVHRFVWKEKDSL